MEDGGEYDMRALDDDKGILLSMISVLLARICNILWIR